MIRCSIWSLRTDKIYRNGEQTKLETTPSALQIVTVSGHKSEICHIKAGVPQGSRLGPLLFVIYMNDIIDEIESDILIFADDTSLFASGSDPIITAAQLNRDLERISTFGVINGKLLSIQINQKI